MVTPFAIAGHCIGGGRRCLVIAEAGVNHNGDLGIAKEMIAAAAEAGADAVKFQTLDPDGMVTTSAAKAGYQLANTDVDESQYSMLKRYVLSREDHIQLMHCAAEHKILFFSTPFTIPSAQLLIDLGLPAIKIPSGEITNHPLLRHVAAAGVPVILSTGMSSLADVEEALAVLNSVAPANVALMHCVSSYPAAWSDVNLKAMDTMTQAFRVPVGYSDHTPGIEIALAAVARGAAILEKHFTLSRSMPGPDHSSSAEPDELSRLVAGVRHIDEALGDGVKRACPAEKSTAAVARKSLVAARDLPMGTRLEADMVSIRRPGTGLSPAMLDHILGLTLRVSIEADQLLQMEMFA